MSTLSFSNDGGDSITRQVVCSETKQMSSEELAEEFEVEECSQWIKDNQYKVVALQFPQELFKYTSKVVRALRKSAPDTFFACLTERKYGSCCVDEVGSTKITDFKQNKVDAIIHYGHSCLSPTSRLPVKLVFGRRNVDTDDFVVQLVSSLPDLNTRLLLIYDVIYHRTIVPILSSLSEKYHNLLCPTLVLPSSKPTSENAEENPNEFVRFGRLFNLKQGTDIADYVITYVGAEDLFLSACMMTLNRCRFVTYDPESRKTKSDAWNINRILMKRYYMIERARDAKFVGILVGTLDVRDYLAVIRRLQVVIQAAGKKWRVYSVGTLNVAKQANVPEFDVFVMVACPENSLVDSSEFLRPIVTPFEMEMACDPELQWTGDYEADFRQLLPGGLSYKPSESRLVGDGDSHVRMDVSLVTGKVRQIGIESEVMERVQQGQMVTRSNQTTLANISADYLQSRSWQGLEPQLGKTSVIKAIQGSKGIAAGYNHEPSGDNEELPNINHELPDDNHELPDDNH